MNTNDNQVNGNRVAHPLPVVLGVDPGFASTGIALVRLLPDGEEAVLLDVLRTSKDDAKRRTLAADDNLRRTRELARAFARLVVEHGVRAICAESMSHPRNASNSGKMSLCWGALAAVAEAHGLPLVQASPQAIKLAVAGAKTASKDDLEFALLQRFGNATEALFTGPDGQREHAFDALAALVACLDSDVVRALRPRAASDAAVRPGIVPDAMPIAEQTALLSGAGRPQSLQCGGVI
jgi:Holliday junction resolvasome RuvABC endonuclease subunit